MGADVIAHSMGGGVGVILADRRPDLVARLVLAEPSLHPTPRPLVEQPTEEEFVRTGFELRLADPVAMYRSELALGPTMPVRDDVLLRLAMPCAVVEGELSGWLAGDPSIRAAGIAVHTVPDAGHTMMLDNPVGFAARTRP